MIRATALLTSWFLATAVAHAAGHREPRLSEVTSGAFLGVEIRVGGSPMPLYSAVDGSGRYYFAARKGADYTIVLTNRTRWRLGADIDVDGLNVISGERDRPGIPGRMYVLDAWESATIRGWRTSLEEVRRFEFVDEERSYAARSGKANDKMGWVEIAVYREQRAFVARPAPLSREDRDEDTRRYDGEASKAPAAPGPRAAARGGSADSTEAVAESAPVREPRSYPGTGWGRSAEDRVRVVSFDYDPHPVENVTLRYEYASGLRALGIAPNVWYGRNRLGERDHGRSGFAQPPTW